MVRCAFEEFGNVQKALEERGIEPISAEQEYVCQAPTELPEHHATEALELIDKLEQDEDVQRVFHTVAPTGDTLPGGDTLLGGECPLRGECPLLPPGGAELEHSRV